MRKRQEVCVCQKIARRAKARGRKKYYKNRKYPEHSIGCCGVRSQHHSDVVGGLFNREKNTPNSRLRQRQHIEIYLFQAAAAVFNPLDDFLRTLSVVVDKKHDFFFFFSLSFLVRPGV